MRRGFEELAGWSSVDRLAQVRAPALVVAGRHDAFTSWPQSERIASRLPDAEMVVFEDSARFPWLEEPEAFFSTVVGWAPEGDRDVTVPRRRRGDDPARRRRSAVPFTVGRPPPR